MRFPAIVLLLAVLAGCGAEPAALPPSTAPGVDAATPGSAQGSAVPPGGATLTTADARHHNKIAAGGPAAPYNYAPSLIVDGGRTKMWWCSQLPGAGPAGDDILYATAATPNGPFKGPSGKPADAVFSGRGTDFDAVHTCDPSVIRVNGTYYLYYTGSAGDRVHGNSIGVATSQDGVHWTRANGGSPVVWPSMGQSRDNTYGVGQPSILYQGGLFYLMYTDTSNGSAGWNGAGQFVIRSADPTFSTGVQALSDKGFISSESITPGVAKSIVDAFSADWMYSDALNAFVVAHETAKGTAITFYDRDLRSHPYRQVTIPGPWQEGPGLVRTPLGHAPVSGSAPCSRVPLDVVRATSPSKPPTDLSTFGVDGTGVQGCQTREQTLGLLQGYGVVSPQRTIDIPVAGGVVRVDSRSVAAALTSKVLDRQFPALADAPVLARLGPGATAVRTANGPVGMRLSDGKLWIVGSQNIADLNGTIVRTVSRQEWDSYPRGADLSRLRG
jgi:hypothetical protein